MVFCVNYTLFTYVNNSIHNYYSPPHSKAREQAKGNPKKMGNAMG